MTRTSRRRRDRGRAGRAGVRPRCSPTGASTYRPGGRRRGRRPGPHRPRRRLHARPRLPGAEHRLPGAPVDGRPRRPRPAALRRRRSRSCCTASGSGSPTRCSSSSGAAGALGLPVGGLRGKAALGLYAGLCATRPVEGLKERPDVSAAEAWRRAHIPPDVVDGLLRPFFSGVLLEQDLSTSRRFTDLMFRMFARGVSTVPAARHAGRFRSSSPAGCPRAAVRLEHRGAPARGRPGARPPTALRRAGRRRRHRRLDRLAAAAGRADGAGARGVTTVYHSAPVFPEATADAAARRRPVAGREHHRAVRPPRRSTPPPDARWSPPRWCTARCPPTPTGPRCARRWPGCTAPTRRRWELVATYDLPHALPGMPRAAPAAPAGAAHRRRRDGVRRRRPPRHQLHPGRSRLRAPRRRRRARRPAGAPHDPPAQPRPRHRPGPHRRARLQQDRLLAAPARPGTPTTRAPASLRGKIVVVTGASSGLGKATAVATARLGATRAPRRARPGQGPRRRSPRSAARCPAPRCVLHRCDVSDLSSVRAFAAALRGSVERVDVLVHNAGVMPPERQGDRRRARGRVRHPRARAGADDRAAAAAARRGRQARVVLVSSGGMYAQRLPADDPEYRRGSTRGTTAYARTKRMQVALTPLMQERWAADGIAVHAMHPGWADTPGVVTSLPGLPQGDGPAAARRRRPARTRSSGSPRPSRLPAAASSGTTAPRGPSTTCAAPARPPASSGGCGPTSWTPPPSPADPATLAAKPRRPGDSGGANPADPATLAAWPSARRAGSATPSAARRAGSAGHPAARRAGSAGVRRQTRRVSGRGGSR